MRKKSRQHNSELVSLQIMLQKQRNTPDEVLQKVFLHPRGVLLWSLRSIQIFWERCQEDATGSIKKRERKDLPLFTDMSWWSEPPQKLLSFTGRHIPHLWPHHSICDVFSGFVLDRCVSMLWEKRHACTPGDNVRWFFGIDLGYMPVICQEQSSQHHKSLLQYRQWKSNHKRFWGAHSPPLPERQHGKMPRTCRK